MSMEFYNSVSRKAKKAYKCEMCGLDILPGEQYSYQCGKFYGDFFTRKMHIDCTSVMSEYCSEVDNEFTYDDISDYWISRYCYKCKHFYPPCKPDSLCETPDACPDRRHGKCTAEETCSLMDKVCWCTKYEEG